MKKWKEGPETHRVDSMVIWSYLISRRSYQTVWPCGYFARNYRDGGSEDQSGLSTQNLTFWPHKFRCSALNHERAFSVGYVVRVNDVCINPD